MISPPPRFTLRMVCLWLWTAFGFLQTGCLVWQPKNGSILVSWNHRSFFQLAVDSTTCLLALCSRDAMWHFWTVAFSLPLSHKAVKLSQPLKLNSSQRLISLSFWRRFAALPCSFCFLMIDLLIYSKAYLIWIAKCKYFCNYFRYYCINMFSLWL